eukprot:4891984-Amphidinium_carterae.2
MRLATSKAEEAVLEAWTPMYAGIGGCALMGWLRLVFESASVAADVGTTGLRSVAARLPLDACCVPVR